MYEEDAGTVRQVAWAEIFPWLILVRCFRLAIGVRLLLIGAVAAFLTLTGWAVIDMAVPGPSVLSPYLRHVQGCPWGAGTLLVPEALGHVQRTSEGGRPVVDPTMKEPPTFPNVEPGIEPTTGTWLALTAPLFRVFAWNVSISETIAWTLCGLWAVAVAAVGGGAITRVAALELAANERIGTAGLVSHVRAKWRAYFAAPLLPLAGVVLFTLVIFVVSLLLRLNFTIWLAGLVWFLMLGLGFLMALLLLGLVFGWPLMWATISTEGTDSFDALSRSYAYVFQRPLHYLFYIVVAAFIGGLGWLLVSNFAAAVIYLTYWAAAWGAGADRVETIVRNGPELGAMGAVGAGIVRFCCQCVRLVAVGFLYSFFWSVWTGIYLLLRRSVDATEMDEVYVEEDEETFGLPPLGTDEAGAPEVAEEETSAESEEAEGDKPEEEEPEE